MAINEAVNIGINVDGTASVEKAANSYEDLGDAVAKTQLEAERLANTFGINDKRTKEAIKVAGQYKQQMEELDFAIDGARGGVATLTRATQAVVGGFEVAAGAAGLFGTESEELQEALLKVQSAMALSQGISDLKEYGGSIGSLAGMVKGNVVKAFGSLRSAIISTGIGAAVVAVGLLIANWDDLVKKFKLSLPTLADIGSKISNIVQDFTDFLGLTSEAARTNDKINESIAKNISETEKQIAIAKAKGEQDKALALEENQRAAELVLAKRKLREDDSEENRKAVEDARHNLELTRIAQDNYAKEQSKKQKENQNKKREDAKAAEEKEFQDWLEVQLKKQEDADNNAKYAEQRRQKELEDEEEMFQAQLEYDVEMAEMKAANADYVAKKKKEADEEEMKSAKAKADLEQEIFDNAQALAQALINIVGQNTKAGKALALASIAADTARALSGALSNSNSPASADNIATGGLAAIPKYIALATTILTNSKRAYDIIKSPAPSISPSRGGGGSSASAVPRFNAPSTRLPGGGDEFTQVRRVYVTERDITNVQDKVKVTESLSQF
jgi:chemotaxis protein histidine kinase CheA